MDGKVTDEMYEAAIPECCELRTAWEHQDQLISGVQRGPTEMTR